MESNNSGDFPGFTLGKLTPFRSSNLISLRRNYSHPKTPNVTVEFFIGKIKPHKHLSVVSSLFDFFLYSCN